MCNIPIQEKNRNKFSNTGSPYFQRFWAVYFCVIVACQGGLESLLFPFLTSRRELANLVPTVCSKGGVIYWLLVVPLEPKIVGVYTQA